MKRSKDCAISSPATPIRTMPYEVKRRRGPFARAYDYDEYEHLARVKEWLTQEAEEEFR